MILDDLLSSDAFTPVNKALAKKLWFICAWYLWELIRQRKRFWESEFYFSQSQMEEEIWINWYTQRQCVKQLLSLWIINVEKKWIPCKYYFTINDNKIIEFFEKDVNSKCFKIWSTGDWKIKAQEVEDLEDINKKESKKESKKLLSLQESSKAEEIQETPLLSIEEEKEKSSAKKEKESYGREDINYLIEQIKLECNNLWVMYDKTKEREFSKHILTAKEFWENAEKCWMNRINFALNILLASIKINYWKWICSWPMKIYQNYSDVYNKTLLESKKKQEKSKVAFIPWIYQDDKN